MKMLLVASLGATLGAIAVLILMIGAQSAFAISAFQSGYLHGTADVYDSCNHPDGCHWYIGQPGNGFKHHTEEFVRGYLTGFCIPTHWKFGGGRDLDGASFDCRDGTTPATVGWAPKLGWALSMKTIISAVAVLVLIAVMTPSAFALTAYQSGFQHGVSDGKMEKMSEFNWYILEPGKGFQFHTWEFVQGYVNGFCSIAGSHYSSDDDHASWDCAVGPESASWVSSK